MLRKAKSRLTTQKLRVPRHVCSQLEKTWKVTIYQSEILPFLPSHKHNESKLRQKAGYSQTAKRKNTQG